MMKTNLAVLLLFSLPAALFAQLTLSTTHTNVTCFNANDGIAEAFPSGGTAPYTYAWSNNATKKSIQSLAPGVYLVTVTDASQNTSESGVFITQPPMIEVFTHGWHQLCDVAPDGWAGVQQLFGFPPYTFLWNTGDTMQEIHHLSAGNYTVVVTDAHGCSEAGSFFVFHWDDGLDMSFTTTNTLCGYENGNVEVTDLSGTPPYHFEWSTGDTTQSIGNLAAGNYSLLVSDANGCATPTPLPVVIGTSYPNPEQIDLLEPFCLNQPGHLNAQVPVEYPQKRWTLSDALDQIIQGQGTDNLIVQWASTGSKTAILDYGIDSLFCGSSVFSLQVAVCAGTIEASVNAISVGPNPFSNYIQLAFSIDQEPETRFILSDPSGKTILRQTLTSGDNLLPTNGIPAGIYFLKVISGGFEKTWKLVKQ